MQKYHKIQTVFFRDPDTKFKTLLDGQYSLPEFDYLKDNTWVFTEKIDGTNIRISYEDGMCVFGGRTDAAQIPTFLLKKLQQIFTVDKMKEYEGLTLFGEGYGNKIQKCGKHYIEDGVDFILFDVQYPSGIWLERSDVEEIANNLGIQAVPIIGEGTLAEAIEMVKDGGYTSEIGDLMAEGIIARPKSELFSRNCKRIITKIKTKDFK